jgi:hypothetical protein
MKIIKYENNTTYVVDGIMNEWQSQTFDRLETSDEMVNNGHYRRVGRTTLICYYADLIIKTRNRNVIVVCYDPVNVYQTFTALYSSFVINEKNKLTYSNGCTIQFIKTGKDLTGHVFYDTDVFFDCVDGLFTNNSLSSTSKIRLI